MPVMAIVADRKQFAALVHDLTEQARALMQAADGAWAFIGIRSRGDVLARRLADQLKPAHYGSVDIALYRDDLSEIGPQPIVRTTDVPFNIDQVNVLLVDDVLMTGRSVRSAIQSLIDLGRPRCIRLLVLVDRGGRELPIAPDVVGLRLDTDRTQQVDVRITPTDNDDAVEMYPLGGEA